MQLWYLNVDGSSDRRVGGADIVLEGSNDIVIEQAITFRFQTSNDQAKYKALIVGLTLAKGLEIVHLECRMDSQMVVDHMKGTF